MRTRVSYLRLDMHRGALIRNTLVFFATLFVWVSTGACGKSTSECVAAGEAICRKACACNAGASCRFDQPGSGVTAMKTEAACNAYFKDSCSGTTLDGMDSPKCTTEAEASPCIPNLNPLEGTGKAAALPVSCGVRAAPPATTGG